MADRDGLKQRREADARVARLGLAANRQDARQGRCISSLEMAELLDEECELAQRQRYLRHISTCESCYREWLDLQQELSHGILKKKKPLLLQRRFLTYSGSLLAAAASVVFYLNLDTSPGPQEPSVYVAPQLERKQSPKSLDIPVQQESGESFAEPAPVQQSKSQFDAVQIDSVEKSVKRAFAKLSGQAPMKSKSMAASVVTLDPVQQWMQRVQKKCTEESSGPTDWKKLVRRGEELSSGNKSPELDIILEKLYRLVAGDVRKPVCSEIQRIMRENNYEQ